MIPSIRRTIAVAMSATALTIVAGGLPLSAQESGKAKPEVKARTAKRAYDPSRRVPNHFGQLGLTEEQREAIYGIQAKHQEKIDELERQLDELRAQSLHECEGVLTATQKKSLADRRARASEARAKRGSTKAQG
jgi:Spy/CpxP family protein refolding chaperone